MKFKNLVEENKQKLFNISSMVKNSKSFDKETSCKKYRNLNASSKFTSSVKKCAKVYKTLKNGTFEVEKITKSKRPLSPKNTLQVTKPKVSKPPSSKPPPPLSAHNEKYFSY